MGVPLYSATDRWCRRIQGMPPAVSNNRSDAKRIAPIIKPCRILNATSAANGTRSIVAGNNPMRNNAQPPCLFSRRRVVLVSAVSRSMRSVTSGREALTSASLGAPENCFDTRRAGAKGALTVGRQHMIDRDPQSQLISACPMCTCSYSLYIECFGLLLSSAHLSFWFGHSRHRAPCAMGFRGINRD